MFDPKWMNLQLFAEGGDGAGDGGNSGGESAPGVETDPGRQRLLALGVPADKIRTRASKAAAAMPSTPEAKAEQSQQDAAAKKQPTEGKAARLTWDELMKDPEYNKAMQRTVNGRLREAKGAQEALQTLSPALDMLCKKYGMDLQNIDHKALAEAIQGDESLFSERALNEGVDNSTARKLAMAEMVQEQQQRTQNQTMREQLLAQHRQKLEQQVPKMKEMFPNFDLDTELQNPTFARLTGPGNVLNLEQAYRAVHYEEIAAAQAEVVAKQVREQMSRTIQANGRRPVEAGAAGAPSVTSINWRNASREQRAALKQRILEAAARGEKVYPGG